MEVVVVVIGCGSDEYDEMMGVRHMMKCAHRKREGEVRQRSGGPRKRGRGMAEVRCTQ